MADRPWHRSLIKPGVRLILGGSRAHVQDWFPGLSIVRSQNISEVLYRGAKVANLVGMDRLRERSGETIYIVGSGPSIRDSDLGGMEARSAILLNGAIGLAGDRIGEPLAIAVEDERFVWRHIDMMRKKIMPGSLCLFSVAVLRALCEIDKGWLGDKTIILIDDIRKPYGARSMISRNSNMYASTPTAPPASRSRRIAGFSSGALSRYRRCSLPCTAHSRRSALSASIFPTIVNRAFTRPATTWHSPALRGPRGALSSISSSRGKSLPNAAFPSSITRLFRRC